MYSRFYLSSKDALLPPSHQHQPGASSLSTQPQTVPSAPPLSPSVCETQASWAHRNLPPLLKIGMQSSLTDIGSVLADLWPEGMDAVIHRLATGGKYALLKHHRKPPTSYTFPTTYMGGGGGATVPFYPPGPMSIHGWLIYSEYLDGGSCVPCALFCKNRIGKGRFVN